VPGVLIEVFPNRVSYIRFIELAQSVLIPLCIYLHIRRVASRRIAFIFIGAFPVIVPLQASLNEQV
jgi:hypothetical protein